MRPDPQPVCPRCGSEAVIKVKYNFQCTRCGERGKAERFHAHLPDGEAR